MFRRRFRWARTHTDNTITLIVPMDLCYPVGPHPSTPSGIWLALTVDLVALPLDSHGHHTPAWYNAARHHQPGTMQYNAQGRPLAYMFVFQKGVSPHDELGSDANYGVLCFSLLIRDGPKAATHVSATS
ncbi:hypothetical protein H4Q26_011362 [Puccinia striiformis f. sp. tritici PST-130]|nr:hypothetical protein H4Q26_011362 [Puccinia striiformis f. sp. tritici PST-130]